MPQIKTYIDDENDVKLVVKAEKKQVIRIKDNSNGEVEDKSFINIDIPTN